jgi:type IV secretion system protein VirD4
MKIPLAILIIGIVLAGIRWAFWPHGRLPKFRAAYTRVRLRLRLHPGRGHATVLELWLRWARLAAFRGSRRSRRSLGAWRRLWHPREHSIFLGRAHYGHGLRLPVDHHGVIVAPPREGKTALISHVILRYPGPVMSTTTKADVFTLTSGVRSMAGPAMDR